MPQDESTPPKSSRKRWFRLAVTAAVLLTLVAIFAILARRTFLRHEFDLSTLIDDSAGIAPSSPVMLNGIDVGHVIRVELSGSPDPDKTVRITMRFARRILSEIPEDSTAAITSANVLGDKYINISRGSKARHVEPGGQIRSSETQDISTFLSRSNGPLEQVDKVMAHIDKILSYVNTPQGTLGKFLNNPSFQNHLTTVTNDQTQLMSNVNGGRGALARLQEIADEIQKPMARIDAIEGDYNRGSGSLGKFLNDPYTPTLTSEAQRTMDEANQLIADFNKANRTKDVIDRIQKVGEKLDATLARIDAGQGTIGQFVVNPQLRDSVDRVKRELDRLTADMKKHPTRFAQISFGLF